MSWILVYITIHGSTIVVSDEGYYDTIGQCFDKREELVLQVTKDYKGFPVNHQAVCIQTDGEQ